MSENLIPSTINYPPALAIEVAVNELARTSGQEIYSDEEIAQQFDMSVAELERLNRNPAFRAEVLQHKGSVKESNGSVKRKASLALEYYLATWVPEAMGNTSVSVETQLKIVQTLSKLAGLDQAKSEAAQVAEAMSKAQNTPQIILNFPENFQQPTRSIPLTAERV